MYYQGYQVRQREQKVKLYGEGSVMVTPDQATVLLGIITEDKDLQQAQQTNAEQMNHVINALLENGIARENIQTSDYRIDLNYDYHEGEQIFRGYRVTNLITITIDNMEKVGEMVDIAVNHGANTVRNISLTIKNKEKYYNQALANAIKNAEQKASIVGQTLGVTVSQTPVQIKELSNGLPNEPQPYVLGVTAQKAIATPIEVGQYTISATVEAIFQY